MSQGAPWLTMWAKPKSTIREIVHSNPKQGVLILSAIYALDNFLFYANWWSLGISYPFYQILLVAAILSPIAGFIWLYFMGWILHFTGRWLKGQAPSSHLRAALAWSRIPFSISVFMWVILLAAHPDLTFVQDGGGPSSLFINFISLALGLWSLILLVQTLREVQGFTIRRALSNVVLSFIISFIIFFTLFNIIRYIYLVSR